MFTIDLLKGKGVPVRSGPGGIFISVITFAVPTVVAMAMLGCYLHTSIITAIRKQGVVIYETRADAFSYAIEHQRALEAERDSAGASLGEIASTIDRHVQWSPILVELVRNVPYSMVLTKLEAQQRLIKKKVPKKSNPKAMMDISVPVKSLRVDVTGTPGQNSDSAVRDFRDALRFSDLLGPQLQDIKINQKADTVDGRDVVTYEIDCVFRSNI